MIIILFTFKPSMYWCVVDIKTKGLIKTGVEVIYDKIIIEVTPACVSVL